MDAKAGGTHPRAHRVRASPSPRPPLTQYAYEPRPRDDLVAIPRVWLTVVLSLVVHALALWLWFPRTPLLAPGSETQTDVQAPLAVRLAPPRVTADATPPREAPPPPAVTLQPPRVLTRPKPPVVATERPAPRVLVPPPPPPAPPAPSGPPVVATPAPPPPLQGDLSAFIAERRRARGESGETETPVPDAEARRDRIIAENMGSLQSSTTFGNAPKNGGGTFQIRRMDFQDAEITFFGWNRDIARRTFQKIEITRGNNPDINIAIVRRIIAIIREHEPGDFRWDSKRLGREMMLSARPADNNALEEFMMQEFFTSARQPR